MEKYFLVDNFKTGDTVATIRLNEPIGAGGISGAQFSKEFDSLVSNGVKKIVIPINSPGGSVFDGLEIFSTIQDSPVETETRVVGIAASIAGVISQAGGKRTIKKYAIFHAHPPHVRKGATVSAELLEMTKNSLKNALMRSEKITEAQVEEILSKESFFDATEATKLGFFDEVIDSNEKVETKGLSNEAIFEVFNSLEGENIQAMKSKDSISNHNKTDMSEVNKALGIKAEASESAQIDALVELKTQAEKVPGLVAEIDELKTELKNSNEEKAKSLVDNAIKDLKISEESRELWVANAMENFASTSKMLDGLKTVAASMNILDQAKEGKEGKEDRSEWGLNDWSKNDQEGLDAMQKEEPAKFKLLLDNYEA